jgi:hypothetical protein
LSHLPDLGLIMQDYEKLGLFYLGRSYDTTTRQGSDELILYDARDLVTHAVCVGMTGSGKTGLCISLLEEAAIDQVPAIAIDPKGDIANLLLTFPQLRGEDFAPWVDEGEARKAGITPAEFAEKQAALWKKGLAEWGQDGARIQRLRDSAEFRIYTPGSSAGLPVSILRSFAAPPAAIRDDAEALNDRVTNTTDSLLGLLGIVADALQSREHILISTILSTTWKAGNDLDIAALIPLIQEPPFSRVGVIELESFFPAKDRFALAMRLNNLLASPGFSAWLEGEPLDIDALLHAPDGKPRISILSIAHLGDAERMFFVSLLLNQVLGWARTQTGTSSLRALLYMDEIFGYFPPVASPPSKKPLLTLLKQARAYGLGVVLATQNPADLDYKGLSNTGTWFLGRLQAERDKLRVLDGLEGAASAQSARFDRPSIDTLLSGLAPRTFLMHNVHEDHPQVFQTRWALSYLRGPLTRPQIKQLMDPLRTGAGPSAAPTPAPPAAAATTSAAAGSKPLLPPEVAQFFIPLRKNRPEGGALEYRPMVLGCASVSYVDMKSCVDVTVPAARLAPLSDEALTVDWSTAETVELDPDDLEKEPAAAAQYHALPAAATKAKSYTAWTKSFVDTVYRGETLVLQKCPSLGAVSQPDESERDFRVRLQQAAKEARDAKLDQLRARYAPKLAAYEEKQRKAELAVRREQDQARNAGLSSFVRMGTTVLGAFMSRKTLSTANINKAGTALRNVGQTMKESGDVTRAEESLKTLNEQAFQLESQFREESRALEKAIDPLNEPLETVTLKPKKSNVVVKLVALVWVPHWATPDGHLAPAWE